MITPHNHQMTFLMIAKVLKDFEKQLKQVDNFSGYLNVFDLKGFEQALQSALHELYSKLCECILTFFCNSAFFKESCKEEKEQVGGKKMKRRDFDLRLCTGEKVRLPGFYLGKTASGFDGQRQLFYRLFSTVGCNCSPEYTRRVALQGAMSPSFDLASMLLAESGTTASVSMCRDLSLSFGEECIRQRVSLQLFPGESLEGKVVGIGIDGGRSRIRLYTGEKNAKGTHGLFDTPWKEPKLLVIEVLDPSTGKREKKRLPIYDCTFGDTQTLALLRAYLKELQVEKAAHVQVVADGATWIWNNIGKCLCGLGVKPENITETLDYYHAVEHLGCLIENLPRKIGKHQRVGLLKQFKQLLWEGQVSMIIEKVKKLTKSNKKELVREVNYFTKHINRCNYKLFRSKKLLCGSGVVESGIRRVINLRFKCPSSFWSLENLEPLIYLRAVILTKRWNNLWENRA